MPTKLPVRTEMPANLNFWRQHVVSHATSFSICSGQQERESGAEDCGHSGCSTSGCQTLVYVYWNLGQKWRERGSSKSITREWDRMHRNGSLFSANQPCSSQVNGNTSGRQQCYYLSRSPLTIGRLRFMHSGETKHRSVQPLSLEWYSNSMEAGDYAWAWSFFQLIRTLLLTTLLRVLLHSQLKE